MEHERGAVAKEDQLCSRMFAGVLVALSWGVSGPFLLAAEQKLTTPRPIQEPVLYGMAKGIINGVCHVIGACCRGLHRSAK